MNFFDKLNKAIACNQSLLCLELDPDPELLLNFLQVKEKSVSLLAELEQGLKYSIERTANKVCAYKLSLELYRVLGTLGLELLHDILSAIPPDIPIILDAKHGDPDTATVFAENAFCNWQVDAVTLIPYAGQDLVAPFLVYPEKAVFILCTTVNTSAPILQEYPAPESPLYLHLANEAKSWGTSEQVALEVGTIVPETLARIRQAAPERIILISNLWEEEETDIARMLAAGLNSNGDGAIVSVSLELIDRHNPAESIEVLRQQIEAERHEIASSNPTCSLWVSNVCLLDKRSYRDLILQLYDIGCIIFGQHVQASGATFPYYIDLRKIISNPQLFHQVLGAYADILKEIEFERIAGIPYGSLPTATGLSLNLGKPMIFPRKEVKAHGTRRLIEGHYREGEKVVVVDDILISGKSVMEGAAKLQSVGLKIEDIVVFIDHEGGVKDKLEQNGYRGHAVLTLSEIAETLYEAGRLNLEQFEILGQ
jgi:uridine monophosphate synthetase